MTKLLTAFALLLATFPALAQTPAPDELVRKISDEVIASLRQDSALRAGDPAPISALVERTIAPHVDFRRMAQLAMGVSWRRASPEQQEQITRHFKQLLVRTYSGALSSYRDQSIQVRPVRLNPQESEVTVRSFVRQSGAEPIALEYDLQRTDAGWKVFDVRVAGVSLVLTYRTSFAEEVRNRGVDGLIDLLERRNRNPGA
jgi:phospholipid transport system substrate-binding protein